MCENGNLVHRPYDCDCYNDRSATDRCRAVQSGPAGSIERTFGGCGACVCSTYTESNCTLIQSSSSAVGQLVASGAYITDKITVSST